MMPQAVKIFENPYRECLQGVRQFLNQLDVVEGFEVFSGKIKYYDTKLLAMLGIQINTLSLQHKHRFTAITELLPNQDKNEVNLFVTGCFRTLGIST